MFHGTNLQGISGISSLTMSWLLLPADSELEAMDTKSLQRFSQNFEADSRSFARSFSCRLFLGHLMVKPGFCHLFSINAFILTSTGLIITC